MFLERWGVTAVATHQTCLVAHELGVFVLELFHVPLQDFDGMPEQEHLWVSAGPWPARRARRLGWHHYDRAAHERPAPLPPHTHARTRPSSSRGVPVDGGWVLLPTAETGGDTSGPALDCASEWTDRRMDSCSR